MSNLQNCSLLYYIWDNFSFRFGFVTFAAHDDVQNVLSKTPFFFKGKKINVGPAVKKMVKYML